MRPRAEDFEKPDGFHTFEDGTVAPFLWRTGLTEESCPACAKGVCRQKAVLLDRLEDDVSLLIVHTGPEEFQ